MVVFCFEIKCNRGYQPMGTSPWLHIHIGAVETPHINCILETKGEIKGALYQARRPKPAKAGWEG